MSEKEPFICVHCRQAPKTGDFRRNYKWKTERGFNNHKCYKDIQLENAERAAQQEKQKEVQLAQAIATAKFQVGDTIHYYSYTVTKPIHVWRGDRRVRVRYEEERRYWATSGVVEEIQIGGYKVGNRVIHETSIFETEDKAAAVAATKNADYKESCEFAARCR